LLFSSVFAYDYDYYYDDDLLYYYYYYYSVILAWCYPRSRHFHKVSE